MGARLFTAILPDPEVVQDLTTWLEPRREAGADVWRWTAAEGWHLTTCFMASVPERVVEPLVAGLDEAAARMPAFEVRVEGGLCFPDVGRAKLLALAVTDGHEQLAALAASCRGVASHVGASPDGARFRGHLTLARARRGFDATRWVQLVDAFPGWTWRASELALVESHLSDRGSRYEVLERFPLGAGLGLG
ncbi:RNA 2',3'-cyclic phosphodiesterase [Aestuariimicrobium sp. Y1814]|uniref:RNA 2',3'-cyclic phosphodiesterase n=1 Tax=Aestuariimicrobium sp. Y1814 TaxID=3418742 RepID=UPI003DA78963